MSFASRIEIATYDDLEALLLLLESVDEPTYDVDPDFTRFFIIREKDKIVGCVGLELFTGTALLRSFAIDREYLGGVRSENGGRDLWRNRDHRQGGLRGDRQGVAPADTGP